LVAVALRATSTPSTWHPVDSVDLVDPELRTGAQHRCRSAWQTWRSQVARCSTRAGAAREGKEYPLVEYPPPNSSGRERGRTWRGAGRGRTPGR